MYFVLAYNRAKIAKHYNKFTIFIIHIFVLRVVHDNQVSTLFQKFFP